MSNITSVFTNRGHKVLIAYITVGYPSIGTTLELVPLMAASGCDMVELGIPFSDPLADGTTIQEANYIALRHGVGPALCLEIAAQLRQKVSIPLILMTYYNPVLNFGEEAFCQVAAKAGIDGVIISDLPPEESGELDILTQQHQLDLIYLLAPTSTEKRISLVAERSHGFIYLVSLTGVTGARDRLPSDLEDFVTRVRKRARQPLCVGFGISNPEQAHRVSRIADGVIVGSRLIQLLRESSFSPLTEFIQELRYALDNIPRE